MINERFGFNYQPVLVPEATYTEKLTAVIASGDIPDIIVFGTRDSNFFKWAAQGAFLPIDDYVDNYPTFEVVPDATWNLGQVGGKLYAIPQYYPPYSLTPSIRQDWLDNLGLGMPTTYEELKQVALAFTEEDPSRTGRDTYGVAMGQSINPSYAMGAYWDPNAWYHKDEQGRLLPGLVTEANRERIQFLADLYAQGAITRDFAVLDWAATNKEFYGGKAGIFIGAPYGMAEEYMAALLEIHPEARPVPIPPFTAPDGSKGYLAFPGANALTAFSAKLAENPDKLQRILEFVDFGRTYYPEEQRIGNPDYEWYHGGEGQGYDVVNGKVIPRDDATQPQGLAPVSYFMDIAEVPPTPEAIDYQEYYTKEPIMGEWAGALQQMWADTNPYSDPTNGIVSATAQAQGTDLRTFLINEHTKMIVGQRGIDTWGEVTAEYLAMGGEQVIEEIHAGIQEREQG